MKHKYVIIAIPNCNTDYHTIIGCEPSRVFHRSVPDNVLDSKESIRLQKPFMPNSQIAQDVHEKTGMILQDVRKTSCERTSTTKPITTKK